MAGHLRPGYPAFWLHGNGFIPTEGTADLMDWAASKFFISCLVVMRI